MQLLFARSICKRRRGSVHLLGSSHPTALSLRFSRGQLINEPHGIEGVASEWAEPVHTDPLVEYFKTEFLQPAQALAV